MIVCKIDKHCSLCNDDCEFAENYEPVIYATWLKHEYAEEDNGFIIPNYECSLCHSWRREETRFCPDCGASMI